jgi:type VI secretion system protein ImpK
MAQQSSELDHDKTTIVVANAHNEGELPLFTPVAVAPGHQAPRNAPYLAQQTSFDEYTPGLNPLINAASLPLLDIIHLRATKEVDLESLRSKLEAEIRGFNAQAAALGISESQVNAAQYLLCTALDECVTTSSIPGAQGEWQQKSLLSTFHKDTWGGEVFFDVLARTMEQPASRLYLLELIYLLLSLGFEGKYRLQNRGTLAIEALRDQLFRQIRLLRGEPSPDLSKKLPAGSFKSKIYAYVPSWLVAAVVVFCMSVTWWGFSHTLESKADPLLTKFTRHAPTGQIFVQSEEPPVEQPVTGNPADAATDPSPTPTSEVRQ